MFFPFIFDGVLSTCDVVSPLRSENSSSQRWQFEDTPLCAHGNYNFGFDAVQCYFNEYNNK